MQNLTQNKQSNDTTNNAKNRLLAAAEAVFAEKGFDAASIRDITAQAKCNVAAVNYHFGSKENLYNELFRRRLTEMREIRIKSIETVMAQKEPKPSLERLLHAFSVAFLEPFFDKASGPLFMKLMVREMSDPRLQKQMFVDELVKPTLKSLGSALSTICPGLTSEKVTLSIISLVGQLIQIMRISQLFDIHELLGSKELTSDQMIDHIVEFSAAGIRANINQTTE
ncbi:MAG: TetR/AcrR family transcriptional regulator [Planctomycetota bacterium]|jgi:AcrR family transcriptional regulator